MYYAIEWQHPDEIKAWLSKDSRWEPDLDRAMRFETYQDAAKRIQNVWAMREPTKEQFEKWMNDTNIRIIKVEEIKDHMYIPTKRAIHSIKKIKRKELRAK